MKMVRDRDITSVEGLVIHNGTPYSGAVAKCQEYMIQDIRVYREGVDVGPYVNPLLVRRYNAHRVDAVYFGGDAPEEMDQPVLINNSPRNSVIYEFKNGFRTREQSYRNGWLDSEVSFYSETGARRDCYLDTEFLGLGEGEIEYDWFEDGTMHREKISIIREFYCKIELGAEGFLRRVHICSNYFKDKLSLFGLPYKQFTKLDDFTGYKIGGRMFFGGQGVTDEVFDFIMSSNNIVGPVELSIMTSSLSENKAMKLLEMENIKVNMLGSYRISPEWVDRYSPKWPSGQNRIEALSYDGPRSFDLSL